MSYLGTSIASFHKSIKGQAVFPQKRTAGNSQPSTAAPSPGPTGNETHKRKRPGNVSASSAPKIVYTPAPDSSQVRDLMSQVHTVIMYLKEKEIALTAEEVTQALSMQISAGLVFALQQNPRLHYDPKSDTFAFKPIHDIRSPGALLRYLEAQTSAQGLSVKELKDGWNGALETISKLEAEREILVTRTKKDNQPRMVWKNDKSLDVTVQDEFKLIWHKISIPEPAELPRVLTDAGLKPTSVDPATIKKATANNAARKKPKRQRQGRVTNSHMSHIIKDFSKK